MRITKKMLAMLLAVMMILGSLPLSVFAADTSEPSYDTTVQKELSEYLLYQTDYVDNTYVGATAKVSVYADNPAPTDKRDVLFYVMNWNGKRIGTETDVNIVKRYIEADPSVETGNKFLVIVLDYGYSEGGEYAKKAVRGVIEHSLGAYRVGQIVNKTYSMGDKSVNVNSGAVYFLPEGYSLERDILFWESDYHSSLGTLDLVLKEWNEQIANPEDKHHDNVYYDYYVEGDTIPAWEPAGTTVGSPKHDEEGNIVPYTAGHIAPKVSRVEDCRKPDGSPMEYNVRLDIIHPAFKEGEEKVKTPVVMVAATQSHRMINQIDGDRNYLGAFLFGGYTGVVYDYAYKPTARQDHYGTQDSYGTHSYNAAKCARAAVRCVRYYAETFGYSDELIGVMGISKGTPTAGTLAAKNNELVPERNVLEKSEGGTLFEGRDENGNPIANLYQPFSTYEGGYDGKGEKPSGNTPIDSNVTVAYVAAGDGINWHYMEEYNLHKHIETHGTVPMVLSCGGKDSYGCYKHWFPLLDYKAANANAPYLAMQMEEKGHEYPNGIDPIRDYDRYEYFYKFFDAYLLPATYTYAPSVVYITPKGGETNVALSTKIEVQLLANKKVEIAQVEEYVTVKDENGTDVTGTWSTTETAYSNLFTFTPKRLEPGTKYTVTVSKSLADEKGVALEAGKEVSFTTEGIRSAVPVADTYVSQAEPAESFVDATTLKLSGTKGKAEIPMFTFDRDIVATSGQLSLVIPNVGEKVENVDVVILDGYSISETTTYNAVKDLIAEAESLGNLTFENGTVRIDVSDLFSYVNSDYFTIALVANAAAHSYSLTFDNFKEGDILLGFRVDDTTEDEVKTNEGKGVEYNAFLTQSYSKNYYYRAGNTRGRTTDIKVAIDSDPERGKVGALTKDKGRYLFYNTFEDRELTTDDVGRTYEVSFWIKAVTGPNASHDSTFIAYGRMRPNGTDTTNMAEKVNLTDSWQKITFNVTLAEGDVEGNEEGDLALFAFGTPAKYTGFTYYIDDISVEEILPSATMASMEADTMPATLVSYVTFDMTKTKPLADTYVSKLFDTNYGSAQALKISGGENESIALISFSTAAIRDINYAGVRIPVNNPTVANVRVSYIPGDIIQGETPPTYTSVVSALKDDATEIKQLRLSQGILHVSLESVKESLKEVDKFTLVIRSTDNYASALNHDFEQYNVDDTLSAARATDTTLHYNKTDENWIGYNGNKQFADGTGKSTKAFVVKEEKDGNKYAQVKASASGGSRLALLNCFGYDELTEDDLGKTYTLTARVRAGGGSTSASVSTGVRDVNRSTSITDGVTGAKTIIITGEEWQTVSVSYTIREDDIPEKGGLARPMLVLAFGKNSIVDIDDIAISVVDRDGSTHVPGASLASKESTRNSCVSLVTDAIDGKEVTLKNVNVIETSVSLAATSEGMSDILFVRGDEREYSLLTLDNASGKLGFVKDDTFRPLCDSKGVEFTVTESPIPVAAIYNAIEGTVRYVIDGKPAYYMDGTECKNTYENVLVEGGDSGKVKIGLATDSNAVSIAVKGLESELRVIGTQTHAYENAVRIVGGIDMLYYSKMGYIVKRGVSSIEKLSTEVYTTIQASGKTVTAAELGCGYITMLALTGIDSGGTFTVTPVAYVDDVKIEGKPVTYEVTVSDEGVSVSEATK